MALDIRFYRPKIALGDRIKGDLLAFGVFSLWIIALVIGNFFQFLTLLIYPISKRIFHEVNRRMAFWFWALCHHVAKFAGVEINLRLVVTLAQRFGGSESARAGTDDGGQPRRA